MILPETKKARLRRSRGFACNGFPFQDHASNPALPDKFFSEVSALGIEAKSPQRSEDLERKARRD
jgi:hypothetical protein